MYFFTNDMHKLTKMPPPLPMTFVICSNKMTSYIQSKCNIQLVGLVTSHFHFLNTVSV